MEDLEYRNQKIPLRVLMESTAVSSLIKDFINQPAQAPSYCEKKFTIPLPTLSQTYEKHIECSEVSKSTRSLQTLKTVFMPTSNKQELELTDYLVLILICRTFQALFEVDLRKAFSPEIQP